MEKAIEKSDIVEGLIPEDNDEKDEINTSSKDPENINIINNDNPKEEKTDKEVIIPVNTKEIDDKKENNENNEIINEEPKIDKKINISEDEKSENDANRKESNLSILSNNIDTGVNSSQVLSMKQKKLRIKDRLEQDKENKVFNILVRAKLRKQRIHTIIPPDELNRFHKNLTNVLIMNFIK